MKKLILPLILIFFCSVLITLSCKDPNKYWKEVPYRFYITAATYNGNLGGIAGADAKCMADINYPGYGTYKAFLASATTRIASVTANIGNGQVDWVLKPNTTYYRSDKVTEFFTTKSNSIRLFATQPAANSITGDTSRYWTGLTTGWQNTGGHCSSWTTTVAPATPAGQGDQINNGILNQGTLACNTFQSLLCVSQTIE